MSERKIDLPLDHYARSPEGMWVRAIRTAEEIALLAAGYRGPLGGEVLWLDFCTARGLAAFSGTLTQGTHTLPDLSANSNDGDPYNGCTANPSEFPRYGVAV